MAKTKKEKTPKAKKVKGDGDDKRLYGTVEKGRATRLEVYGATYQGRERLHIREHYLDDDEEWRPTKKGFTLADADQIALLIDTLKSAMVDY